MSIALAVIAGMFMGSIIVLVMGALAAAHREDDYQARLEHEANRRYIERLEQELIRKELGDL